MVHIAAQPVALEFICYRTQRESDISSGLNDFNDLNKIDKTDYVAKCHSIVAVGHLELSLSLIHWSYRC